MTTHFSLNIYFWNFSSSLSLNSSAFKLTCKQSVYAVGQDVKLRTYINLK